MKTFTPHELDIITLDDIQQMKSDVLLEIEKQKDDIVRKTQQITAPYQGIGGGGLMGTLRTAYAVYTGVSTGIRLMRSIRKIFR